MLTPSFAVIVVWLDIGRAESVGSNGLPLPSPFGLTRPCLWRPNYGSLFFRSHLLRATVQSNSQRPLILSLASAVGLDFCQYPSLLSCVKLWSDGGALVLPADSLLTSPPLSDSAPSSRQVPVGPCWFLICYLVWLYSRIICRGVEPSGTHGLAEHFSSDRLDSQLWMRWGGSQSVPARLVGEKKEIYKEAILALSSLYNTVQSLVCLIWIIWKGSGICLNFTNTFYVLRPVTLLERDTSNMGYTGPIVNPQASSADAVFWNYGYVPHLAMGIIGVLTFIGVAGPHLWYLFKRRGTRSVHGLFFFTCIVEALGYGARLSSHRYPFNGLSFLIGIFLIQAATILLTAGIYKSIQRLTKHCPEGRHMSPMRPRSLLVVFLILDVVWVLMQIAGQYFYAGAQGADITGDKPMFAIGMSTLIFLAGNVLQAITIIIVTVFVYVIYRRSSRILAAAVNANKDMDNYPLIHPALIQICITMGLFFIRLIMRIADGAQDAYGYAATHEVFFGIFEYLPILCILILWAVRPLYKFLPLRYTSNASQGSINDIENTAELKRDVSATATSHAGKA
nr:hypothetical protein L203_03246 [Cryptococcus depauperatus CBS 7841]